MTDEALTIATDFIAKCEAFRADPYQDVAGVWTIGYGFTFLEDGSPVTADTPAMAQEAAETRLQSLVAHILSVVRGMVTVALEPPALAALTSFAFNLGTGALHGSTLLRLVNSGDMAGASQQFANWCHAGGVVVNGLVQRRAREAAMFESCSA